MKISLIAKEKIIEELKQRASNSQIYIFVGLNRIKAFSLNVIRNNLRKINANLFVAKNTLIKKAFSSFTNCEVDKFLKGEVGIVFAKEDVAVETCKILVDAAKENEFFGINGAIFKDKELTPEDIKNLAKLPSREVLLGMAVSTLASPLTNFVGLFYRIIANFLYILEQIKEKKGSK